MEFYSSNPNVICESWRSSIITEITARVCWTRVRYKSPSFIGTEFFWVQSGETICVGIHKSSICLQLANGNHYLWLEGLAARREARASLQLTHWTTHWPLDGICDKVILPLDYEILSAFISRQITGKVQYYIYWFSTTIRGVCVPTLTNNICLLKRCGNKIISSNLWRFLFFLSCHVFQPRFPQDTLSRLSPSY